MNKNDFVNSGFARLYTWMAKAKYTMGIFFVAYVVLYLFFGLVIKDLSVSLDFLTAVQMLFACLFIGVAQKAIIPADKVSLSRCALWTALGTVITVLFALIFNWFGLFPGWCFPVFTVFMIIAMQCVVLGDYFELHRETKDLNRKLEQFQNRTKKET